MKKKIAAAITAAALSVAVLSGCSMGRTGIISIEKSSSDGLVDYYTITYTDGTTDTLTVTNGMDGQKGETGDGVTALDAYNTYKEIYDSDITYDEFLKEFLTLEVSDNSGAAAVNACLRSCLKVYTVFEETTYSYDMWHRPVTSTENVRYSGSAVIYKMDEDYTYLVTNYHVVFDADATDQISSEIHAYLYGSESAPTETGGTYSYGDYALNCEYVGGSITCDVAILKVDTAELTAINSQATPVSISYDYHVGETTYAIGNPDDEGISVTRGIVSVDSEYTILSIDGTYRQYRSIRTDSDLTHGSSGGGLFNADGELIGLNNSGSEDTESINNAIPATILTGAADGIIYYANDGDDETVGTYKTFIGVSYISSNSRYVYDESTGYGSIFEDVIVDSVTEGGVAYGLGLQKGDRLLVLTINGVEYRATRNFVFSEALLTARAGDEIKITYDRANEEHTTEVYTVQKADLVAVE